jgi:hypothetical protein
MKTCRIGRFDSAQNRWVEGDLMEPEQRQHDEPDDHHRPEHRADRTRAAFLRFK